MSGRQYKPGEWHEGFEDPPPLVLLQIESASTNPGPPYWQRAWYRGGEDDGEIRWYGLDGEYIGRSCDTAYPKHWSIHPSPEKIACEYLFDEIKRIASIEQVKSNAMLMLLLERFAKDVRDFVPTANLT